MTDKEQVTATDWADGMIKLWRDFFAPATQRIVTETGLSREQAVMLMLINQMSSIVHQLQLWVEDGRKVWEEGKPQRATLQKYTELGLRYMKRELKEDDEWRGEDEPH